MIKVGSFVWYGRMRVIVKSIHGTIARISCADYPLWNKEVSINELEDLIC